MRPKLYFYRPKLTVMGGIHSSYLLEAKDELFKVHFKLVVISDHKELKKLIKKKLIKRLIYFINPDIAPSFFPQSLLSLLRERKEIQKIALHNTDPFSYSREVSISVIERSQPDAIFIVDPALTFFCKLPDIPLFYLPWSICNSDINEFSISRNFDLFVSSRNAPQSGYYTWRCNNIPILKKLLSKVVTAQNVRKKEYLSRMRSAKFSPTCGSCTNTFINKHIEIPASGVCLITEKTQILEYAGFSDLENCIMGTGDKLKDKVISIRKSLDKWEEICRSGIELIRSKHVHDKRTQVRDFFSLREKGVATDKMYQNNPFDTIKYTSSLEEKEKQSKVFKESEMLETPRDLLAVENWKMLSENSNFEKLFKIKKLKELKKFLRRDHLDLKIEASNFFIRNKMQTDATDEFRKIALDSFNSGYGPVLERKELTILCYIFLEKYPNFTSEFCLKTLKNLNRYSSSSYFKRVLIMCFFWLGVETQKIQSLLLILKSIIRLPLKKLTGWY